MVFDPISLKSEALLLVCRDIISSYENSSENIFEFEDEFKEFIQNHVKTLKKGINAVVQNNEYYLRNQRIVRIKMILKYYELINKSITKAFEKNNRFNPTMLCFSMLATWFKEFGIEAKSKEFIFFSLYPYGDIYDKLLVKMDNKQYKELNIFMIQISENIITKLYKEK